MKCAWWASVASFLSADSGTSCSSAMSVIENTNASLSEIYKHRIMVHHYTVIRFLRSFVFGLLLGGSIFLPLLWQADRKQTESLHQKQTATTEANPDQQSHQHLLWLRAISRAVLASIPAHTMMRRVIPSTRPSNLWPSTHLASDYKKPGTLSLGKKWIVLHAAGG